MDAEAAPQRVRKVKVYEYIYDQFEALHLNGVKIDTFQKMRIKNAVKFTIAFMAEFGKKQSEEAKADPLAKEQ